MTAETHEPKKRGRPKGSVTLTPKQQKFLDHYVAYGNASDAYRKAYNVKAMSDNAVSREASLLLRHPMVSQFLLQAQNRTADRLEITVLDLVKELEDVQKKALAAESFPSVVAAIVAKAKILGKITNRTALEGNVNHSHTHDHLTRDVSESDRFLAGADRSSRAQGAPKASLPH